jgi:hypothetical protein
VTPGLVIVGGTLQLLGLLLVFAEIAAIRAHEWGIVPPWTRLALWMKRKFKQLRKLSRLLRRRHVVIRPAPLTLSATARSSASAVVTPGGIGEPGADASDAERLVWLSAIARRHDDELKQLRRALGDAQHESRAEVEGQARRLQEELDARDVRRRAQLEWSIRRQAIGATCVAVGLVLGTVGALVN